MSRVGRKPIKVGSKVKVRSEGATIVVEGPLGSLTRQLPPGVTLRVEEDTVHVTAPPAQRGNRGHQGLARALLYKMIVGVQSGFERGLEVQGVGYKAEVQGDRLKLQVGRSHVDFVTILPGLKVTVDKSQSKIRVSGTDNWAVGQMAASIRGVKKPEPFKGKGIKYDGEIIRRKAGKAGSK